MGSKYVDLGVESGRSEFKCWPSSPGQESMATPLTYLFPGLSDSLQGSADRDVCHASVQ